MHGETPSELKRFFRAFGAEVECASYLSAEDAEACVLDLRDRGVLAVVGPGLVTELAEKAGMKAVFLYSRASVRAAFETALEVAQATLGETQRRQRLDQLLQHLRDGVVALTARGRIEAIEQQPRRRVRPRRRRKPWASVLLELAPDLASAVCRTRTGDALVTVRGVTLCRASRCPRRCSGAAAPARC